MINNDFTGENEMQKNGEKIHAEAIGREVMHLYPDISFILKNLHSSSSYIKYAQQIFVQQYDYNIYKNVSVKIASN